MLVVSDTSPILNLSAIGRLDLLRELYTEIVIPPAVHAEFLVNAGQPRPSWCIVVPPRDQTAVARLRQELDPGEAEAIVLAGELHVDLILMDERRGRSLPVSRGLEVTGLLGVLAEARKRGLISACQPLLDDMIQAAGFWIGNDLRTRYLRSLNEIP